MREITVALGDRSYPVLIGAAARHELSRVIPTSAQRAVVITQDTIRQAGWLDDLHPGIPFEVVTIGDGEAVKTMATVESLCRQFVQLRLSRSDVVVAVGGGIVTDVTGFAAASYLRGTALVNIATSLLAQVDAAIGGKTGVNLPEGKNLVGAFWQPTAVLCDTEMLSSLPPREMACGKGEIAKYVFLGEVPPPDAGLDEQVAACVAIKAEVVAADEQEGSRRMILNYGHTLAHALEGADLERGRGWDLRHGEAVAIGLLFAARLAERLGRIDAARVELHRTVLGRYDLPTDLPQGADAAELLTFMARDKKAHHDLTFVLDGPEGVEPVTGIAPAEVLATLADMGAHS